MNLVTEQKTATADNDHANHAERIDNIRCSMSELGISQNRLARLMDVSKGLMSEVLNKDLAPKRVEILDDIDKVIREHQQIKQAFEDDVTQKLEYISTYLERPDFSEYGLSALTGQNIDLIDRVLKRNVSDERLPEELAKMISAIEQIDAERHEAASISSSILDLPPGGAEILDGLDDNTSAYAGSDYAPQDIFVETFVTKHVFAACERARRQRMFSVIVARAGCGKTTALMRYQDSRYRILMVEAEGDNYSPAAFVDVLLAMIEHPLSYETRNISLAKKFHALLKAMKGEFDLLIIDEAERCRKDTLEYARRISDLSEVGITLAGTPSLNKQFGNRAYDQIGSRTVYNTPVIDCVTAEDGANLLKAYLPQVEWTPELVKVCMQASKGSPRLLCRSICSGIHDYLLAHGRAVTPQAIIQVADKLLNLKKL